MVLLCSRRPAPSRCSGRVWSRAHVPARGRARGRVVPLHSKEEIALPESPASRWRFWLATVLVFLAAFALIGSFAFHDPGIRKQGRVVMDEGHSDWEWSTEGSTRSGTDRSPATTTTTCTSTWTSSSRWSATSIPSRTTCCPRRDVLIIKTPTTPFSDDEIASIERFVRDGGGLFLIGDHTNVFGTSTNMNPLAEEFGLRFNHDATYELTEGGLSEYVPPDAPHPIVRHLPALPVRYVQLLEAASIECAPVITGTGAQGARCGLLAGELLPGSRTRPRDAVRRLLQGAAVQHGRGRVAAFADSTVFSNFWMFMPGKPELAVSYVEWLNRQNALPSIRLLFLALAAVLLVPIGFAFRGLGRQWAMVAACVGALVGVPVAVQAYGLANQLAYPLPDATSEFTQVRFEQEYSDFSVQSTLEGFEADPQDSLNTFYVWTQRVGYVPSMHARLDDALAEGDIVVVVDPVKVPGQRDVSLLTEFVEEGGSLLVLDSGGNRDSTADAFLEPFGLTLGDASTGRPPRYERRDGSGELQFTESMSNVEGGKPLLTTDRGDVPCAYASVGEGVVVACGDSGLFFNSTLGEVNVLPSNQQRHASELEFALMRFLAGEKQFEY